ncbi:MAG TPA: hypothetical protein VMA37_03795 [Acetobacteraceae bacterium]|nr:hypothetical protein [Acetobacteraceae bacterium]
MPRGEGDMPIPGGNEPQGSRRGALIALLVIVAIIVGGLFLWNRIARMAAIQDCVAEGRTNCVPIAVPSKQ